MARTTPVHSGYNIINGTSTGSNGPYVDCWLEWKLVSQSVSDNTSTVHVLLYAASTRSSTTAWSVAENFGYVGYDGGNRQYRKTTYDFANYAANCFGDYTFIVPHDSDGAKAVKLEGAWNTSHSSYISGGSVSATVTLPTIEKNLAPPVVSGSVEDCNPATLALTGDKYVFVRGVSDALCTITATAGNGATITEKTVGGVVVTGNSHTITGIETGSVVFTATDSRGSTGQYIQSLSMLPYVQLTCNAAIKRVTPTGTDAVLTVSGQCWRGHFGTVGNGLIVTCRVNGQTYTVHPEIVSGNSYTTTLTIPDLDYTRSYRLEVTATDNLSTVTKVSTVQKGQPVFDWGEKDFQFHVPVYFPGNTGALQDYDMDDLVPGAYCITSSHPVNTGVGTVYTGVLLDIPYLGNLSCRLQVIFTLDSAEMYVRHKWFGTWNGFIKK